MVALFNKVDAGELKKLLQKRELCLLDVRTDTEITHEIALQRYSDRPLCFQQQTDLQMCLTFRVESWPGSMRVCR